MNSGQGQPGKDGYPAVGSTTGIDSIEDLRERLSNAALQIQHHAESAQTELEKLKLVVNDLLARVEVLEG